MAAPRHAVDPESLTARALHERRGRVGDLPELRRELGHDDVVPGGGEGPAEDVEHGKRLWRHL
jgi:hypothetical protein